MSIVDRVKLFLVAFSFGVNLPDLAIIPLLPNQTDENQGLTKCLKDFYARVDERDAREKFSHFSQHEIYLSEVIFIFIFITNFFTYNFSFFIGCELLFQNNVPRLHCANND